MHKLVIQDDEGKTTVVPLIRDEITVGRKEGNTIRLTERNVSRKHARILRADGAIAIEDLESSNGVRVNGTRIHGKQTLTISDRIQIGDYLIELKSDGDSASDAEGNSNAKTMPLPKTGSRGESEGGLRASSSIPIPQIAAATPFDETIKHPASIAPSNGESSATPATAPKSSSSSMSIPVANAVTTVTGSGNAAAAAVALSETPPSPTPAVAPIEEADPLPEEERIARLIVLSRSGAGTEYELKQAASVVGRTDDNDIVIDHRSISRHHAKIVKEGNQFVIVDLESSNGVRVNNEEYGKVDLRSGDLIDLGHVRLRFAGADDDYVFHPDDIDDVAPKSSRGIWYALLVLVLLVATVATFVSMFGEESSDQPQQDNQPTSPSDGVGRVNPSDQAVNTPLQPNAGVLLERARRAVVTQDWALAVVESRKVLDLDPDNERAHMYSQQATRETANEVRLQGLKASVEGKRYSEVPEKFAAIDDNSVYKEQAQALHDRARREYIEQIRENANDLLAERKCNDLTQLGKSAGSLWSEAGQAVEKISARCRPATPPRRTPPPRRTNVPEPPRSRPPPVPTVSFDEVLEDAKAAARGGLYGRARRLCGEALRIRPGDQEAILTCGIAACGLGDARLAKRYHGQASGPRQSQIYQVCLSKGIDVRQ